MKYAVKQNTQYYRMIKSKQMRSNIINKIIIIIIIIIKIIKR
jgi:hypothetical protein